MIRTQSIVDDDIYGGYDDYPSVYSTKDLEHDVVFQEAVQMGNLRRNIVIIFFIRLLMSL